MTRVVAMLALLATSAYADKAPSPVASPAPWAQGVSDEQKAQAKVLLDAGNALLLEKKYVEALDKYAAAVAVWDHPAIRFNMVRCQIQLGRNLEAYENLELALKYGAAPLEETVYNEAVAYQKLLATQIGDLKVSCAQPGVKLTLDGQPLASCPAQETRRVLAGPHQVVGTKQGLMTKTLFVPNTADYLPIVALQATPGRVDMLMRRYYVRTLIRTRALKCELQEKPSCSDGVDNDCDGTIDTADSECN